MAEDVGGFVGPLCEEEARGVDTHRSRGAAEGGDDEGVVTGPIESIFVATRFRGFQKPGTGKVVDK